MLTCKISNALRMVLDDFLPAITCETAERDTPRALASSDWVIPNWSIRIFIAVAFGFCIVSVNMLTIITDLVKTVKRENTNMAKKIGERISKTRNLLGLNQAELSLKIGLKSAAAISRYETGEREPSLDFLISLTEMANINLDWLIKGTGPMFRDGTTNQRPPPQPEDIVEEKILLMLKDMDEEKKRDVLKYVQKEKLLMELMEEREKAGKSKCA